MTKPKHDRELELSSPLCGGLPISEAKTRELISEARRKAKAACKLGKHVASAQHYAASVLFALQSERIDYVEVMELLQSVRDAVCLRSSQVLQHPYAKAKTSKQIHENRTYL
jgi:hypothetical protein